ncbi:hypothetical protein Taro_038440 [Colocasia esculenta]|uniref:RNase H type-1 domain-containing protein n=1 Tax=Colocasia esculenta TaxID=4460 RepID=A0A843WM97_COLES|nr:hypothetical protein [Colocasia esculenta]
MFVDHFTEAFKSAPHQVRPEILAHIPNLLTSDDNSMLCIVPTPAEIKKVVHSMDPDSAPRPDDDTLIFSNASMRHLRRLMSFLNSYEEASGQLINKNKRTFYVPTHATDSLIQKISKTMGFSRAKLPIKYLRVSIYSGHQKSAHFAHNISKTVNKLQGWKKDLLSSGGRLILIQHILAALPIYTMNAMPIPTTIVKAFHKILANFFWGSYEGSPKRHWKSWDTIAQPKESGGLGVLNLHHMQIAFRTKMMWKALTTESIWAIFFRGKHLFNCHHFEAHFPSMLAADRKLWRQAAHIIHSNHRIISMDNSPTTYFWYDIWTGEVPLKEFIPEDTWNNMPHKDCTVQEAFTNPTRISNIANQIWSELFHLLNFSNREINDVPEGVISSVAPLWQFYGKSSAIGTQLDSKKIPQHWLATLHQNVSGQKNLETRIPSIVPWLTPPLGRLKLNVDGAFTMTSGEAGGGGILRDNEGKMCWAFARAYHVLKSSLAAEALALRDGLSICCSKGITEIHLIPSRLSQSRLLAHWTLPASCNTLQPRQKLEAEISHARREANRVADCLASFGMSCPHVVIWDSWADLPTLVKEPYHFDKAGYPSIRP